MLIVNILSQLEPAREVIELSVANAQDSRVNELYVQEGDRVSANQLIATLQGLDKKQVKQIESELEDYYVCVPIDGQIFKVNTLVGEQVDTSQGIVELGRTDRMYAIAEVCG